MGTTSPLGIPYPDAGDPLANVRADIQALAEYVDDTIAALSAVSATSWATATPLGSGWSGTAQYKRGAGAVQVVLDGIAKSSWSTGDTMFTLPAGFRPSRTIFCPPGQIGGSIRLWKVLTTGEVQTDGSGTSGIYGSAVFLL